MFKLINNEIDVRAIVDFQESFDDIFKAMEYAEKSFGKDIVWWVTESGVESVQIGYNGTPVVEIVDENFKIPFETDVKYFGVLAI